MEDENFVVGDDASIWTVRSGAGFPIILCNGGPGCGDYLKPIAGMLDDAAQVIRFEERGCGRSRAAAPYDIEISLRNLENIRRHYRIDRWIVGGHSWGADLALFYALKHAPQTAGLICIAGGRIHNDREWHAEYKRAEKQIGEQTPDLDFPPNMEVNEQVNRSWKRYIQNPVLLRSIAELKTPALFVYAEKDIRPSWATEQIANLMPNARFESVKGAQHLIWSSHANELKSLLRNFVDDITGKSYLGISQSKVLG